jgi:hypothetical protein
VRKRKAVADVSTRRRLFQGRRMNYTAFTNDSLTMMYEAVRGALAADDALKRQGMETRSAFGKHPSGNGTPANWSQKCSSAECFSTSSTGRKIKRRYPSTSEALRPEAASANSNSEKVIRPRIPRSQRWPCPARRRGTSRFQVSTESTCG